MSDLDFVSDIGRRHLIEAAFEADGGIIVDHALMSDVKRSSPLLTFLTDNGS